MSTAPVRESENRRALTLREATVGSDLVIENVAGTHCDRLRDLGFRESLQVRKLANGRNLVCSVCGTRLAISRELAAWVKVRLI